jgi:hypothetical protein
MSSETLRMVYFAYVHSIMSYGITFWGNQLYSDKIFKIQKRAIRIITNSRMRNSCRELFKKLEILPLYSQYICGKTHMSSYLLPSPQFHIPPHILSISIFVVKNKHLFYTNKQIHSIHTRSTTNLHPLTAHLTQFQKGVYYSAFKIFNNLPHDIKDLASEVIPFQNALKRFLLIHSFYNSDEYYNYKSHCIEHWKVN